MTTLKFIGSGSAFNTKLGNNSAYLKFNNDTEMLLLDCGTTVFERIKSNNILDGVEKIHVAITHTHDDHIGSLSSLILFTYYSHGQFAQPKVNVYYSDGVEVNEYLAITGCLNGVNYNSSYIEEGTMSTIGRNVSISFNASKHVDELQSYSMDLKVDGKWIYYSGDVNGLEEVTLGLISEEIWDEFYVDTCKADYEGNVHISLRLLNELIPESYRSKVYCMHLDEGFVREEAEELGFNVVENDF